MKTVSRFILLLLWCVSCVAAENKRPNLLLIMSDDMGFSDLGCYGSEIQTPNLDSLAQNGIRFTQFYNMARCCPTRASLLTGLYPHQAGVGHMTDDRGHDGYRGQLNRQCVTIAEVLRAEGYRTYICGKWHVSRGVRRDGERSSWPVQRGFEKFYGTLTGAALLPAQTYSYRVALAIATNTPVVINELMAANSRTLADPQGDYDDWIELHNITDQDVDLTGRYS